LVSGYYVKPPRAALHETKEVRLAEVLATLSLATDLAMAFPPEMALRTCLLAIEIGRELDLGDETLADLYYVSLLRHIGCTAFSHEEAFFGDDNAARGALIGTDVRRPTAVIAAVVRHLGVGGGATGRVRAISGVVLGGPRMFARAITAHCDASARLAEQLGMSAGVIGGLNDIFERWDGKGVPRGLGGEAISVAARITGFSHTVVLHVWRKGAKAAREMVRQRAGGEFDPTLAAAFLQSSKQLLEPVAAESVWDAVLDAEPASRPWLPVSQLDRVAIAFASFSDLKSPFFLGHSRGVAELAEVCARNLALSDDEVLALRLAAMLHDLGRVSVSNGIWEKPGALTAGEWERVRLYPYHTERTIGRMAILRPLAALAGSVQERLDGSGYHRGVPAAVLSTSARLLAAADAYQAMTEERSYRPALSPQAAARELHTEVEAGRLDHEAVNAVREFAGHRKAKLDWPAGLTDREVDVLRRVAQAKRNKVIAAELVISQETVRNHVRHVYEKIGVSSRAGAALFAMEHDLIRN
jgi:HD-GYP domain-containing protein (c-di-GMP phosphodiesterase class II)